MTSTEWKWCDFSAGWFSGLAAIVIGHPLDTLKVREQTMPNVSGFTISKNTLKFEGIQGFFKGMMFPALSSGVLNSVLFGVYGNTMLLLESLNANPDLRRTCAEGGGFVHKFWHLNVFIAGSTAGLAQALLACPIDIVKVKLQTQTGTVKHHWANHPESGFKGPIHCAMMVIKDNGFKGLYHGFLPMLFRDMPTIGVYLLIYEHSVSYGLPMHGDGDYSATRQFLAGGVAGAVSWQVVTPFDVVKSRMQADCTINPEYNGMIDCFIKSYKHDGIRVFGRGFFMISLRGFAVNSALFLVMERCLSFCNRINW